jgi:hypothetical protein
LEGTASTVVYSYHLQAQGLVADDLPAQENFCQCFVPQSAEHFFVSSVLFADEARFGIDSIINIHNQHQWAEENHQNHHGVIHCRHQQQFSINVWAGIVGECLVGPHVSLHQLTVNHYRDFII